MKSYIILTHHRFFNMRTFLGGHRYSQNWVVLNETVNKTPRGICCSYSLNHNMFRHLMIYPSILHVQLPIIKVLNVEMEKLLHDGEYTKKFTKSTLKIVKGAVEHQIKYYNRLYELNTKLVYGLTREYLVKFKTPMVTISVQNRYMLCTVKINNDSFTLKAFNAYAHVSCGYNKTKEKEK